VACDVSERAELYNHRERGLQAIDFHRGFIFTKFLGFSMLVGAEGGILMPFNDRTVTQRGVL
jgi:hypothetical protein